MKSHWLYWLLTLLLLGAVGCGKSPATMKYKLTYSIEGQGNVTPPSGSEFAQGSVVTLTPTPADGWAFSYWNGPDGTSVVSAESKYVIAMDAHKNITAVFTQLNHTIKTSVSPTGSGSIEIAVVDSLHATDISVEHGQTVQITAKATPGYAFDHWEGDPTGIVNPQ